MLQKVEEKLSKIKLKITGDISLEAFDESPQFSQRVLEVVDSKKTRIAEILSMSEEPEVSIKEL